MKFVRNERNYSSDSEPEINKKKAKEVNLINLGRAEIFWHNLFMKENKIGGN